MAQTCTGSRTRMMPTSSEDGAHASKVYQHQQHAASPARTRRSEMHEGTHSSRTAHAIEPGPKMQHSGHLGLCCILGPEHGQRPSAAQRVPSIANAQDRLFHAHPLKGSIRYYGPRLLTSSNWLRFRLPVTEIFSNHWLQLLEYRNQLIAS